MWHEPLCLQIYDRPYPCFCLLVPGCCCCQSLSHVTLCDPMDCSTPGFSVLHHLSEISQTHVLWVSDGHPTVSSSVIPFSSYLQSFPASGSFLMSWLFSSRGQSIGASASAWVLLMNIQGWFPLGLTPSVWSPCSPSDSQESSPAPQFKSINSLVLSFLYSPTQIHTWLLEKT